MQKFTIRIERDTDGPLAEQITGIMADTTQEALGVAVEEWSADGAVKITVVGDDGETMARWSPEVRVWFDDFAPEPEGGPIVAVVHERWNGWAVPLVTRTEAQRFANWWNGGCAVEDNIATIELTDDGVVWMNTDDGETHVSGPVDVNGVERFDIGFGLVWFEVGA